jgi:hypothetical protein
MKVVVLMFMPRFAPLVECGSKLQTVRPPRKRPIQVGDIASLREWTGEPYRSPQRILREAKVIAVESVSFDYLLSWMHDSKLKVSIDGSLSDPQEFAIKDGFSGWPDMAMWFSETHGFPFRGTLIKWEPILNRAEK